MYSIQPQPLPLRELKILSQVVAHISCKQILPSLREIWIAASHFDHKLFYLAQIMKQMHILLKEQPRFEFMFLCRSLLIAELVVTMVETDHFKLVAFDNGGD